MNKQSFPFLEQPSEKTDSYTLVLRIIYLENKILKFIYPFSTQENSGSLGLIITVQET